jgi:hypothetical protein
MKRLLMLVAVLAVAACGKDSTAPAPIARVAAFSYAKCGTVVVENVVRNRYNVTVAWSDTRGESWRALFVRNSGLMLTDVTSASSSKESGCVYVAGDRASAYLFIGQESRLTDEVTLAP